MIADALGFELDRITDRSSQKIAEARSEPAPEVEAEGLRDHSRTGGVG